MSESRCPHCYSAGAHEYHCRLHPVNRKAEQERQARVFDDVEYGGEGY